MQPFFILTPAEKLFSSLWRKIKILNIYLHNYQLQNIYVMERIDLNLEQYRPHIKHGGIGKIAKMAGVSVPIVSKALGGSTSSTKLPQIAKAVVKYLEQVRKDEAEALKSLKTLEE